MTPLAKLGLFVGAVLAIGYGFVIAAPRPARKLLGAFSRSREAAWVLTAIDMLWAGKLLYHAPLGRFDVYKPLIYVLTPVAIALIGVFVDELLAPRALGGLFLLLAAPILDVARWHASPMRLVLTILAYLMVVKGMILIVSPYKFRKWTERLLSTDGQCRFWGSIGCVLGILILVLSLTVY